MRNTLLAATLTLFTLAHAYGQGEKKYGDLKFGGVLYSFYYYNLTNTQPTQNSFPQEKGEPAALGYNQFDLERVYLNLTSDLSAETRFRVTTDIFRNAAFPGSAANGASYVVRDTSGKTVTITTPSPYYSGVTVRLKYAYFDWLPTSDVTVRMGMQQTPWFDFDESVWRYRGVQQTPADKNGFLSSADLGLSFNYALPSHYGALNAYLFNGNGYAAPEFNRFKDVALRAQLVPMPADETLKGLKLTLMGYFGSNLVNPADQSSGALRHTVLGGMLSYEAERFNVAAEYVTNTNGAAKNNVALDSTNTAAVLSIYGSVKAPGELQHSLGAFARVDFYSPTNADISAVTDATANAANTKNTFVIAGLAWNVSSKVTVTGDYQATTFAHAIATQFNGATKATTDGRFFLHGIVSF